MTVKDRIKFFCKNANITISEFEKTLNVANGYVNSISKSVGIDKINIMVHPTFRVIQQSCSAYSLSSKYR